MGLTATAQTGPAARPQHRGRATPHPRAEGTHRPNCGSVTPMTPAPKPRTDRPESNLVAHARCELRIIGEDDDTIRGLTRVIQAFADMGHSGASAHFATQYLERLLRYQPLSELTDDPGEWIDRHAEGLTPVPLWQSKRNPEAFSTDAGKTYYLLSEQEASGDLATTPLHRSKVMPQADQPMEANG